MYSNCQRLTAAVVIALCAFAAGAGAAEPVPADWAPDDQSGDVNGYGAPLPTLSEVVAQAYQRYPDQPLAASRREYAAALTRQADSLIAGNPALALRYQTDRAASDIGLREWEAGVELPIWRPGQRDARAQLGERTGGAADAGAHALQLEVAGKVREAVWDVFMARNRLAQAEREWRTAQALENDVNRRVTLGEMAKTDLLLAQDETFSKRDAYLALGAEVAFAMRRYAALTGLTRLPRRKAEPHSPLMAVPADHPLLASLRAELERAQSQVTVARHERAEAPQVLFGARQEKAAAGTGPVNSVGLSMRWPLATKTHSAPRISAAEIDVTQAQANLLAAQRRLQVDLHDAQHELEVTEQRLQTAQQKAEVAQENLRLAQLAFSLGETDLVHRLRVQTLAFAAERAERELRLQLQRAIARYNQAVGEIP